MKATATRKPENTRRKILEAAFAEFYKNGFQGGSINHIVEEAGATKGALFHHFKGKNDLGYAVRPGSHSTASRGGVVRSSRAFHRSDHRFEAHFSPVPEEGDRADAWLSAE